jgi:GTP-binding protein
MPARTAFPDSKRISATFVKGVVKADEVLDDGTPQIAFIGRSNVGKSSIINALTGRDNLARTSSFPGRTQEINVFSVNGSYYLIDLPGYGFIRDSKKKKARLHGLIDWYLFGSHYQQKAVVFIIDAEIGPTDDDLETLRALEEHRKSIVVVANKADKIARSKSKARIQDLQALVGDHPLVPFSSKTGTGIRELARIIFGDSSGLPHR